ncbi:GDSL-type esterase/lipase family protein [Botrimarina sp.]|uniref:GDSL-type esterase/lipase family protein n=1 Tax=Botrimarina sp. TaxID=2795802 RepID=UPI0032ED7B12
MSCRCLSPLCLVFLFGLADAAPGQPPRPDLSPWSEQNARWAEEVGRLEALDREQEDPEGAVLLIGSSSIRLWETAAEDLAPYPVIRRGYGGAQFSDLAHYAQRLIEPHDFRAAVVFVANDITGGPADKTPEEVGELFGYVAEVLRWREPDAPIICCDVRPAPLRFGAWREIQQGNAALRAECEKRPGVYYLDTADAFLRDGGAAARDDLYGPDRLHLSRSGYELWGELIKAELDRVLADRGDRAGTPSAAGEGSSHPTDR